MQKACESEVDPEQWRQFHFFYTSEYHLSDACISKWDDNREDSGVVQYFAVTDDKG